MIMIMIIICFSPHRRAQLARSPLLLVLCVVIVVVVVFYIKCFFVLLGGPSLGRPEWLPCGSRALPGPIESTQTAPEEGPRVNISECEIRFGCMLYLF